MAVYKITTTWTKILDKQPREVTLLITLSSTILAGLWNIPLYLRLGDGEADIFWQSKGKATVIQLPVPANTAVYARVSFASLYISCTIIPSMEEE